MWRLNDDMLTCLLRMTLRMVGYIDERTQRMGLLLLQNLAEVATDTSLQWHSPTILWTIQYVVVSRDATCANEQKYQHTHTQTGRTRARARTHTNTH